MSTSRAVLAATGSIDPASWPESVVGAASTTVPAERVAAAPAVVGEAVGVAEGEAEGDGLRDGLAEV